MSHPCEDDLVCKATNEKVPYFNAPIFLDNKQQVGKVDEIFGAVRDFVSFFIIYWLQIGDFVNLSFNYIILSFTFFYSFGIKFRKNGFKYTVYLLLTSYF